MNAVSGKVIIFLLRRLCPDLSLQRQDGLCVQELRIWLRMLGGSR